jgi:hypothetical protein
MCTKQLSPTVIDSESDLDVDYGMLMHLLSNYIDTSVHTRTKVKVHVTLHVYYRSSADENDLQTGSRSTTGRRTVVHDQLRRWSRLATTASRRTGDDAYEYTYNEDNGQEAELETVKTSTTINTKRTSPHNNKFRLMTINSVTFVKTKIAIMMIRNLQMQRSTKISFQEHLGPIKKFLCLLYPDTKNRKSL